MVTARDKGDSDFEPIPEGMTHGICFGVLDMGTQYSDKYGKNHKCVILWETPEHRNDWDGEDSARHVSLMLTVSLNAKSNMRPFLENWRGKKFTEQELNGFSLKKLLGVNADLQLMHDKKGDKTYTNVTNALPWRGDKNIPLERDFLYFSFEDDDAIIPEKTPEWIIKMIKNSDEWGNRNIKDYQEDNQAQVDPSEYEDDIPF